MQIARVPSLLSFILATLLLLTQSTQGGKRSGCSGPAGLEAGQGQDAMGMLKIERIGGFAGFGLPGSKLKSSGEQAMSALSAADQATVEAMFRNPGRQTGSGQERDAFRYRITRTVNGKEQTVEVPESTVPPALKACVSDKLM